MWHLEKFQTVSPLACLSRNGERSKGEIYRSYLLLLPHPSTIGECDAWANGEVQKNFHFIFDLGICQGQGRDILEIPSAALYHGGAYSLQRGSGQPGSAARRWGVVQLVGHLTVNEDGEGSNPSAPAKFPLESLRIFRRLF